MRISELTQQVNPSGVRRVLLLPFEDQELQQFAEQSFPEASLTILRKHDLAGLSLLNLVRRVRSNQWDLAIASMHSSAVRRSQASVELLVSFSKARERFVRADKDSLVHVDTSRIAFLLIPQLLLGTLIGVAAIPWTYGYLLLVSRKLPQPFGEKQVPLLSHDRKTVLFLRTDLSGSVRAGGSVSHVKGMIKAFMSSGFKVIYVADAPLSVLPPEVTQLQMKPLTILDFFDEFQLLHYNLRVIRRLGNIVERFKPSFIYQRHAIFNFAGGMIANRFGIPLVLEANDSEVWIRKHWSRLALEDLATRSEALALQLADRIAVNSTGVQEQLAPYRIKRDRYLLNPNGVDPDEFHPDIDGTPVRRRYGIGNEILVGFIGTFTRWHGIETLFDAAVIATQQESRLRFLLIGEGDLRSALEKRSMDLGLQGGITFAGLVPHSEAPRHLAACDILVSPHLGFQDGTKFFGSPTKLFEYMAMGKPIIASRLEQIGEVIVDGVNGLHMNPGDVRQLADLILKLARDGRLRDKLGAQARQDVIRKHTWNANVERIVKSFESSDP
jgi:glycosyltransferase involved in cell wall biosynthesis